MSRNKDPLNYGDYRPADGHPDSEYAAEDWLADNPQDGNSHGTRQEPPGARDNLNPMRPGDPGPNPLGHGLILGPNPGPQPGKKLSLVTELKLEIGEVDWRAAPSDDPVKLGEVVTKARSIARRLVSIVLAGKDRDSIEAARLLFAYVHGLPVQPIEFDVAKVVMDLAEARGLDKDDVSRALQETKRILAEAKANGSA